MPPREIEDMKSQLVITCPFHAVFGYAHPTCGDCARSYIIPSWRRGLERVWYWLSPFTFGLWAERRPLRWFEVGVGVGIECGWVEAKEKAGD